MRHVPADVCHDAWHADETKSLRCKQTTRNHVNFSGADLGFSQALGLLFFDIFRIHGQPQLFFDVCFSLAAQVVFCFIVLHVRQCLVVLTCNARQQGMPQLQSAGDDYRVCRVTNCAWIEASVHCKPAHLGAQHSMWI